MSKAVGLCTRAGVTPKLPKSVTPAPTRWVCEKARSSVSAYWYPEKCWKEMSTIDDVVSGPNRSAPKGTWMEGVSAATITEITI